jgi:hypothetical protein
MNPELILSFLLMQGLSPPGTSVPVEAVITSADGLPAWARFTFQVFTIQRLQEELNQRQQELAELREHHAECEDQLDSLKKEIRILFDVARTEVAKKHRHSYDRFVGELVSRPDLPLLVGLYTNADGDPN